MPGASFARNVCWIRTGGKARWNRLVRIARCYRFARSVCWVRFTRNAYWNCLPKRALNLAKKNASCNRLAGRDDDWYHLAQRTREEC